MKKVLPERKAMMALRARKKRAKSIRRMKKKKGLLKKYIQLEGQKTRHINFTSPEVLCLEENQRETLNFFSTMLNVVSHKVYVPIHINFNALRKVSAGAALLLAAILHCWSKRKGRNAKIKLDDQAHWDSGIYFLLDQMGLFDLIPVINPPQSHLCQTDIEFLKFFSGSCVDTRRFRPFRKKIQENFGEIMSMKKLYGAVVEAMTNAAQHAYPSSGIVRERIMAKSWWSFAGFNWTTNVLTICFCDLGVGIPYSLPREHPMEYINSILRSISLPVKADAKMIKAAMTLGRSKTGTKSRGKGLPEMKQIIDANPHSNIKIYSLEGCYQYSNGGEEKLSDVVSPVPGTLIEWSFKIEQVQMRLPLPIGDAA